MGTDINFFAEKLNSETRDWEYLPAPDDGRNPPSYRYPSDLHYHGGYEYQDFRMMANGDIGFTCRFLKDWFDERNYDLFGWLAGVRQPAPGIEYPRGWPANVSPELWAEVANVEHSASWFTINELRSRMTRKIRRGFGESLDRCLQEIMRHAQCDDRDVRVLFYFDS